MRAAHFRRPWLWLRAEVESKSLHLDYVTVGKANADEGEAVLGLGRLAHRLRHEHVLLCIYTDPKTANEHGNRGESMPAPTPCLHPLRPSPTPSPHPLQDISFYYFHSHEHTQTDTHVVSLARHHFPRALSHSCSPSHPISKLQWAREPVPQRPLLHAHRLQ